eukprot:CAMPEP_0114513158 /NCGR_PEP_ID=MMETSP0109-20121206/15401_1 /TAXON_ID=29199 /ORGANISM="Chlorarachnion reptans, Strain CCCM449" /LENGTH=315 /DNA_ID=CAMNT_0001692973 /DNA_START=54 /DNA_END=1001 /DNA_ORIENTATION=+
MGLKGLYGGGNMEAIAKIYKEVLGRNLVDLMKDLIQVCRSDLPKELEADATMLVEYKGKFKELGEQEIVAIKRLWESAEIQKAHRESRRVDSKTNFLSNTHHLIQKLDEFAEPDYLPDAKERAYARMRTTGISEQKLNIEGKKLKVVDVGGMRSERRKWVHTYENVKAIVFCVSLSDYNEKCFEDHTTNRLQDSLALWEKIANETCFGKTQFLLLFTKKDLLSEKLEALQKDGDHSADLKLNKCPALENVAKAGEKNLTVDEVVKILEEQFLARVKRSDAYVLVESANITEAEEIKGVIARLKADRNVNESCALQ